MHLSAVWSWLYWAWVASEVVIAVATRTRRTGGEIRDRGTQLLLWVVIFVSIASAMWISDVVAAPMFSSAHWLRVSALWILVAGLAIRWAAILNLGSAFSANVLFARRRESEQLASTTSFGIRPISGWC